MRPRMARMISYSWWMCFDNTDCFILLFAAAETRSWSITGRYDMDRRTPASDPRDTESQQVVRGER